MCARPLILAVLVLVAGACKPKDKEGEAGKAGAASKKAVTEAEKQNAYINCSNKFMSRAYQARDRYLSWADAKTGPTGKEKIVFGVYALTGDVAKDCRAKIAAVAHGPSMPDLEAAGEQLVVALEQLAPLLEEANAYYSKKGHTQDKMAKGKELHPKLMAAFEGFEKADAEMGKVLDVMEDKNLEKQLEELASRPDRSAYFHTNVIFTGKKLVRLASGVDELEQIDLPAFEAALATYAAAVDAASKAADPEIKSFASGPARGVVVQASNLVERRTKKIKWNSGDKVMINGGNPQMVDGHPAAVVRAYNDMINASNRL